jgi:hypothetical protein
VRYEKKIGHHNVTAGIPWECDRQQPRHQLQMSSFNDVSMQMLVISKPVMSRISDPNLIGQEM